MAPRSSVLALLSGFALMPGLVQAQPWFVLSREDGCFPVSVLFRDETPAKLPSSPQEFAELMRRQGRDVRLGPVAGLPAEYADRVVRVDVGEGMAPVFVREDVCRNAERAK